MSAPAAAAPAPSVRRALALTLASNYTLMLVNFVAVVILSRLLTPAELGVYAVAAVFSGLAGMLRDFGVGEYLIQEKELTQEKIRAAMTVNLAISWGMTALLMAASGPVAAFYQDPGVARVLQVLALSFLLTPFGAISMACLRRELKFEAMYWATLVSGLGSAAVSVALAWLGHGAMSLAWSSLVSSALLVAVALAMRPPGLPWLPGLRGLPAVWRFGSRASGVYVFGQIGRGAPDLVIGRMLDMDSVGLFSRAGAMIELFHRVVMRGVRPVMLPYLSARRRAGADIKEGFLRSAVLLSGLAWPAFGVLGLLAWPVVRLVFGPQWLASAPLMQFLCAAFAIEVVFVMATEVLIAAGQVGRSTWLQAAVQGIKIVLLLVAAPFGLTYAAAAMLLAALAAAGLVLRALRVAIGLRLAELARACAPSLALAILAASPAAGFVALFGVGEPNYLAALAVGGGLGMAAWLAGAFALGHPLAAEIAGVYRRARGLRLARRHH